MDGYHFCKTLKIRERFKDIPIIMCTLKNTRDDVVTATKAGADDYLIKPFSSVSLLNKCQEQVAIYGK